MGSGTDFKGANHTFGPPKGLTEDEVKSLRTFVNGNCIVSCWQLSDEELAEINRTGKVFLSVWSGKQLYPVFVGSETTAHQLVSEYGSAWTLSEEQGKSHRQLAKEAAKLIFDYADNNLSMFEACTDTAPVKAKELFELAKQLHDRLAS